MKNIKLVPLEKYEDASRYRRVEDGVYVDLSDKGKTNCRMAVSLELEEGEDTQYPLEDVLDEYSVHVSDFIDFDAARPLVFELAGPQQNVAKAKGILGKRVYNQTFEENGKKRVRLAIE